MRVALLLGILAISAPIPLRADDPPKPTDAKIDIARLIELHNARRAEADAELGPLKSSPRLEAAARLHAEDMARHDKMSHEGSDGSNPAQRVDRQGYKYQTTGENVAMGQRSSEQVMEAWMNSPHHKENILKPEFTEIGAACVVSDDGTPFWCVDFGRPWPEIQPEKAASEMLSALNAARAEAKLGPLKVNRILESSAMTHARAMAEAGKFLDKDPDGQTATSRARRDGYPLRALVQNDASGQPEAEKAVATWLKSKDGRKALLGDYSDVGVGVAASKDGVPYWCLLLGKPMARSR